MTFAFDSVNKNVMTSSTTGSFTLQQVNTVKTYMAQICLASFKLFCSKMTEKHYFCYLTVVK